MHASHSCRTDLWHHSLWLSAFLQERFHDLVPALSRWSGTVVGMTLMAIGLMGIYETYFAQEEEEEGELKLAMAGGWLLGVLVPT